MQRLPVVKRLPRLVLAVAACWAVTANAADLVEQGKEIATKGSGAVIACATCHGAQGEGNAIANFPFLAGQGSAYITEQLKNFASGERVGLVMAPMAKAMSEEQIAAVSAYFAQLPAPFAKDTLTQYNNYYPKEGDVGAWLVHRGDWANNLPACIQCHDPATVGVGDHFPALAGLSAHYIEEQLNAWKKMSVQEGLKG